MVRYIEGDPVVAEQPAPAAIEEIAVAVSPACGGANELCAELLEAAAQLRYLYEQHQAFHDCAGFPGRLLWKLDDKTVPVTLSPPPKVEALVRDWLLQYLNAQALKSVEECSQLSGKLAQLLRGA